MVLLTGSYSNVMCNLNLNENRWRELKIRVITKEVFSSPRRGAHQKF